jgi:hypothetical protein
MRGGGWEERKRKTGGWGMFVLSGWRREELCIGAV